jgi:hypothetical protein
VNKVIHIRRNKVYPEDKSLSINRGKSESRFKIPKSQIISKEGYKDSMSKMWWMKITVTDWFFRKSDLINSLKDMIENSLVFVEGDRSFRINWDEVRFIVEERENECFYCNFDFSAHKKTKDHVVPKSLLKALDINSYPNNLVVCCEECNKLKSNFALREFRMIVKKKLASCKDSQYYSMKWKTVLETIKRIEYNGKYKGSKRVFARKL